MKPNQQITQDEAASGFRSVLAGIGAGCIALGLAIGLLIAGMPWLAFSAACYGSGMVWLAWECGCAIQDGELHDDEEDTL